MNHSMNHRDKLVVLWGQIPWFLCGSPRAGPVVLSGSPGADPVVPRWFSMDSPVVLRGQIPWF